MTQPTYRVRAAHCPHTADDLTLDQALRRITDPLERSWERLEAAEHIVIKANYVWPPDRIRRHAGRNQELVDEAVLRAVLRLLRARTKARITLADTSLEHGQGDLYFLGLLAEYGVDFINCNEPPFATFSLPDGAMFREYVFHDVFRTADAVISLATLKSHNFMGVTLCCKNLFGLCPVNPAARPRWYYHHIIRMPYFLPDLAQVLQPCLNLVDGLVAQSGREWGGEARVTDCLLAGEQTFATDFCGAVMMGHNPMSDFPTPPFRRDRNHLRIAAEQGWGPAALDQVDFQHDLVLPVAQFDSDSTDPPETVEAWHRTMAEQALAYAADPTPFHDQYAGEYMLVQDGNVLWHGGGIKGWVSRRELAGAKPDRAIWFKFVDPSEAEGERFDRYEALVTA